MTTSQIVAHKHITALSLGAGYGSVGMALMLEAGLLGDTPMPDVAVFADTQAEPPHVYDTLQWLRPKISYPLVVATAGSLLVDTWHLTNGTGPTMLHPNGSSYLDIPIFGDTGLLKRQCTQHYKVEVIKKAYRQWADCDPPRLSVTQYIGISVDEAGRMRDSNVQYITNAYPLVDHRVNRAGLKAYLDEQYPSHPVRRSACFFCPFHSIAEWRDIRASYPDLYEESVKMERAMGKMEHGPFYLYNGKYGKGLENAMANADMQGLLWPEADQFQNECEGQCGV